MVGCFCYVLRCQALESLTTGLLKSLSTLSCVRFGEKVNSAVRDILVRSRLIYSVLEEEASVWESGSSQARMASIFLCCLVQQTNKQTKSLLFSNVYNYLSLSKKVKIC